MSDELYPIGPIGQLDVQRISRTITDEFEDGSTTARRLWTAKYFKRRFSIRHQNLSSAEFRKLASFFTARDGNYDSFWFRDNWNRGGNAKVRLSGAFPIERGGAPVYSPQIVLDQTAPVRELPDYDEVSAIISNCGAWYDANRIIYGLHDGTPFGDLTVPNQSRIGGVNQLSALTEQSGLISPLNVSGYDAQWQYFYGAGAYWLRGDSVDLSVSQPAASLFCLCKVSSVASKSVVFALGTVSTGAALGIAVNASNQFEPWLGGAESWTNAKLTNVADTWHSVAVVWPSGSNNATLYVDGVSIGTDAVSRAFSAGRVSLLGSPTGTLLLGSGLTNSSVNHAIFKNGQFTLANIQALHNLFAHQYGLTLV